MRSSLHKLKPLEPSTRAPAPPAISLPPGLDQAQALIEIHLPLEFISPVVGGGVLSREPDATEALRLPGLRGQLRMWWRALPRSSNDATKLFEEEAALWGGVSLNQKQEKKKPDALRSRVGLRVLRDVPPTYLDLPAGRYQGQAGSYKALPSWEGGPALGYALFPLQYERDELNRLTGSDPPTRDVRHRLKVTLVLTLTIGTSESETLRQLLATLWAWLYLGGIGARTTRGFGAPALQRDAEIKVKVRNLAGQSSSSDAVKELQDKAEALIKHFEPPKEAGLKQWWNNAQKELLNCSTGGSDDAPYPRLPPEAVLCGPSRSSAQEALKDGLQLLLTFRQGRGFARRQGSDPNRPGRTNWPEADTLRRFAKAKRRASFGKHEPFSDDPKHDGAPRAAFGMPLNISFKDREDKMADGTIVPVFDGARWTSPLRMRPLRTQEGRFVCWVIKLRQPLPPHVPVQEGKGASSTAPKAAAVLVKNILNRLPEEEEHVTIRHPELLDTGANSELQQLLRKAKGDAVQAFLEFMTQRGFKRIEGEKS